MLVRIDREALPLLGVVALYKRNRGYSVGEFDSIPNVPNVGADLPKALSHGFADGRSGTSR